MKLNDNDKYFNYLRMSSDTFNELLNIVGPKLTKLYCVREPISAGERLSLTLRYLASGDSMKSVSYSFRMGHNTVSKIVKETCEIIWECLQQQQLKIPTTENWLNIASDFEMTWNMPHCVGAIDGKHIVIQAPPKSGSTFFNYKGSHSIVLLAACDANYRFTLVDIGAEGRHSGGGIFKNSTMGKSICMDNLKLPQPSPMGCANQLVNYYFVADEAFPLSCCIMRPYPGKFLDFFKRIFNYRLSRARRTIENAFGILASRWRIFRKPIIASIPTVEAVVKATICLHNFLANSNIEKKRYISNTVADLEDKICENLLPIGKTSSNMYSRIAEKMRQFLANYFVMEGAVSFQWDK